MTEVVSAPRLSDRAIARIVDAAAQAARELSAPCAIAVVNPSGQLRAFLLMDGASPIAAEIVVKKARTSAYTGAPTGALDPELASRITAVVDDFIDFPGGLPVVVDGVVVAGIGAGGHIAEHDVAVAQAGLDAVTS